MKRAVLLAVVLAIGPTLVACPPARPRPLEAADYAAAVASVSADSTTQSSPLPAATKPPATNDAHPPDRIAARHILVQYMGCTQAGSAVVRTREQAREVAKDVLRRLRAGVDFARMAVEYSDEPGAGQRGGALGRFDRKAMDKTFTEAAFALKVNEISEIVETPFGFHIIQRME